MAALETWEVEPAAAMPWSLHSVLPRPRSARAAICPTVDFGKSLRRQCAELAGAFAKASRITLTCTVEHQQVPQAMATDLALIALGLIANASSSFAGGRHGRIGVLFRVAAAELELTVEHSGPGTQAARDQADEAARLEQRLVARLGGRLTSLSMIGGVRIVVTVPWP